jgi:hypothetical protein
MEFYGGRIVHHENENLIDKQFFRALEPDSGNRPGKPSNARRNGETPRPAGTRGRKTQQPLRKLRSGRWIGNWKPISLL